MSRWEESFQAHSLDSQATCLNHDGFDVILAAGIACGSALNKVGFGVLLPPSNTPQHCHNFLE